MGILSGIEIALRDIIGKASNKAVYELLGGQIHSRLRTYTYLNAKDKGASNAAVHSDPDIAAERAVEYVKQGFTAVKFGPARP